MSESAAAAGGYEWECDGCHQRTLVREVVLDGASACLCESCEARAITPEQWAQMGVFGKDLRSFIVRRSAELGLELDKAGTAVLLLLVHTAEPSWSSAKLRARLVQMLDLAFVARDEGALSTAFGPALPLNVSDPVPTNRDSDR